MAAMCYSSSVWIICSEIIAMSYIIICAKFCKDTLSNKWFHIRTWFQLFRLYGSYMLQCSDISGSNKRAASWKEKDVCKIQKIWNKFWYIQADMAKSSQHVMLIIYIYIFIGSSSFNSGCYKLRGKFNIPYLGYKNCSFWSIKRLKKIFGLLLLSLY